MDIKGAFDTVSPFTLINRLRIQGWPEWLIAWTRSLVSNRTNYVSIDGANSTPRAPWGGLPQGSPISPVLFMLYIEPIVKAPGAPRFGYADDILNLYIGDTLTDLVPAMEADYQ